MAILVKPLTSTQVDKAKPKDKEYVLNDGQGLRLRILPNGKKTWLFNYKNLITGKRTNLKIGDYPSVKLADARAKRELYLEYLSQGKDPQVVLKQEATQYVAESANTFKSIASKWIEVKASSVTDDYAQDAWRSLELHLFPLLGNTPIHALTPQDIIHALKPIEAKGKFETIRRLCQRTNEIMVYAVNTGVIPTNQLANIKSAFQAPKKKHMATLPPERLGELVQRIYNASITLTTRNLLLWQLHTMTRPTEAAGARWEEIDFENNVWIIPASRMKKNLEHRIPLTEQSLAVLERMKAISGHCIYIFPSDRDRTKHTNSQTANMALKRMGYGGVLVAHGLRALASTTLNEKGFASDLIESALAHLDKNEVRRAYNRTDYLTRRREMMTWWSNHINYMITKEMNK
ncbi:integrase domain-containing protein [Photobacterium leiognathi]|uniref:integrase domain-containing protein n=1 Tax=Photobacterium leiognathi TaxID=553611 RepID=UPI002738C0ED|nr:integrase domain-containing protein [Photobacterium leiognathi]